MLDKISDSLSYEIKALYFLVSGKLMINTELNSQELETSIISKSQRKCIDKLYFRSYITVFPKVQVKKPIILKKHLLHTKTVVFILMPSGVIITLMCVIQI